MHTMYDWQKNAYDEWEKNDYVGIIEAVTGAGKTLVAHYAMIYHLNLGYDILIIVPNIELQRQWYNDIRKLKDPAGNYIKNKYKIKLLGGGNKENIAGWKIIIAVVNSAIKHKIIPKQNKGLLIADECHHYGAPRFKDVLKTLYNRRLGLTATFQREDDGIENYLTPYFNNICYSLSYRQALDESVIAHFKIAFVGVDLSKIERVNYNEYQDKCTNLKKKLFQNGVNEKNFGEFMRQVSILSKKVGFLSDLARTYLREPLKTPS